MNTIDSIRKPILLYRSLVDGLTVDLVELPRHAACLGLAVTQRRKVKQLKIASLGDQDTVPSYQWKI